MKMIRAQALLLIIQMIYASGDSSYDEDINMVLPATLTQHSPIDQPAMRHYATFGGCDCRDTPDELIVCYGEKCDAFPVGIQVNTPLFKLKLSKITSIKRDDMLSFPNITALEIESNLLLVHIEPGCFRHLSKLKTLTIMSNFNLKQLDENVFEGLNNLELLDLRKNGFTRVIDATRALSPKYVPHLNHLELRENMLGKINKDDFYPMNGTGLEQLNLILCQIEYIHPECLQPLRNLTFLRIGQNLFNRSVVTDLVDKTLEMGIPLDSLNLYEIGLRKTLPYEMLEAIGKTNLSYLNLGNNHFDYIADDDFPDMPHLSELDLRQDLIINISPHAFRKLVRLEGLLLAFNKLSGVPKGALLPTLYELDLGWNSDDTEATSYFNIDEFMFVNMTRLYNLQLSYNNIAYILKNTFVGMKNLTILNLKNCSLYNIEPETFVPLGSLLHLNLINNPMLTYSLTPEVFVGLENLHVLLLGGCALTNLTSSPNLFSHMPNLTYLGLERNGLHTIAPNQFKHLNMLRRIDLHDNKLTPWTESIMPVADFIMTDLGQNKITYVTVHMLEDWSRVGNLLLDGNPLSCDCSLYPMYLWVSENNMLSTYMIGKNLTGRCVSAVPWRRVLIRDCLRNTTLFETECASLVAATKTILISLLITILILLMVLLVLGYMFRWYFGYWMFLYRIKRQQRSMRDKSNAHKHDCITYKYDAFVSYCSEDRNYVMRLVSMLENFEPYLKLCIYERDFQIGANISEAILQSVAVSKRTLLVVSDAFAKSQWCRWETQLAEYHQLFFYNETAEGPDDTLLMVKLEEVSKANLTPTLKYLMKTRIYLEWDPEPKKQKMFWSKLRNTLSAPKDGSLLPTS